MEKICDAGGTASFIYMSKTVLLMCVYSVLFRGLGNLALAGLVCAALRLHACAMTLDIMQWEEESSSPILGPSANDEGESL